MSVHKISQSSKPANGYIRAKNSIPYKIYKNSYIKGKISIKLRTNPQKGGNKLIVFYAYDPTG